MKPKTLIRLSIKAILLLAATFFFSSPAISVAQEPALPCSWPVKVNGHGITNVAAPDTDATYWVMPINTARWSAMIVNGQYPTSRFFSFATYLELGGVTDSIVDANISADPGTTNPFASPESTGGSRDYTVTIDGSSSGPGNHIHWGDSGLVYVIYRIYVPDKGLGDQAGVSLPNVQLLDTSGNSYPIRKCPTLLPPKQLPGLSTLLTDAASPAFGKSCPNDAAPQSDVVFAPNTSGGNYFPNPATNYISAQDLCFQPGKIIVVRGRAPVFPNTYNHTSIFQPAIPGSIQMRYWSMCNNDELITRPVVACKADYAAVANVQPSDTSPVYYTYVISVDLATSTGAVPSWVPPDATWLPWGDPAVAKALLFREMLPVSGFSLTGDYLPRGVYCDKELFVQQGWQGCFDAAGVAAP